MSIMYMNGENPQKGDYFGLEFIFIIHWEKHLKHIKQSSKQKCPPNDCNKHLTHI